MTKRSTRWKAAPHVPQRGRLLGRDGETEVVVLQRDAYDRLVAAAERRAEAEEADTEDRADIARAEAALAVLAAGKDETIDLEEMRALRTAPTPLHFWRRKRGLSQADLAKAVGTAQSHISQIEAGAMSPSFDTMRRIAETLGVSLDDL